MTQGTTLIGRAALHKSVFVLFLDPRVFLRSWFLLVGAVVASIFLTAGLPAKGAVSPSKANSLVLRTTRQVEPVCFVVRGRTVFCTGCRMARELA